MTCPLSGREDMHCLPVDLCWQRWVGVGAFSGEGTCDSSCPEFLVMLCVAARSMYGRICWEFRGHARAVSPTVRSFVPISLGNRTLVRIFRTDTYTHLCRPHIPKVYHGLIIGESRPTRTRVDCLGRANGDRTRTGHGARKHHGCGSG